MGSRGQCASQPDVGGEAVITQGPKVRRKVIEVITAPAFSGYEDFCSTGTGSLRQDKSVYS